MPNKGRACLKGRIFCVKRIAIANPLLWAWVLLAAVGCARLDNTLFQVSTIDALLEGVYDGDYRARDLTRQGTLGLGTFNALDGEMVLLDGVVYQVRADGAVIRVRPDDMTPFATVVRFRKDDEVAVPAGTDYQGFQVAVDAALPSPNLYYAFRAVGTFQSVKTRSVPRQDPPYRRLAEVVEDQSEFEAANVRGTLLGFRCPDFTAGVNVPGYHLHFLSDDRTFGGHVLSFTSDELVVEIDRITRIRMLLPEDKAFLDADLSEHKTGELDKVEK
jgi:acetolactate decarboxylase